jgi:hypothetical protein
VVPVTELVALLVKSLAYVPDSLYDQTVEALQPEGMRFLVDQRGPGHWEGDRNGYHLNIRELQDPWLALGGRFTWEVRQDGKLIGVGPADSLEDACSEVLILIG